MLVVLDNRLPSSYAEPCKTVYRPFEVSKYKSGINQLSDGDLRHRVFHQGIYQQCCSYI